MVRYLRYLFEKLVGNKFYAARIKSIYKLLLRSIQKSPVFWSVSIFFVFLFLNLFMGLGTELNVAGFIALIGLIFTANKYKLDEANYHKSLFDERYSLYLKINDLVARGNSGKVNNSDINEIDMILNKAQFLFCEKTIDFIYEIREHLITLAFSKNEVGYREKEERAFAFLAESILVKRMASKFPELNISNY